MQHDKASHVIEQAELRATVRHKHLVAVARIRDDSNPHAKELEEEEDIFSPVILLS